jgi:4-diphosphocytidyl-2-C-methyl-D-erythritol kinase
MQSINDVLAPAKLNLFLHINERREDGYHLLQSVFMMIDWYDKLDFELLPKQQIERIDVSTQSENHQKNALPANDLCVKAARALQKATGCEHGVRIFLEKNLPQEAGLGGGSSNAASTLLALNKLWNLNLSRQKLIEIAVPLGADVPFFLFGSNAWVEGIGEKLEPIKLDSRHWVILKPLQGVSTQQIFQDSGLQRNTKTVTIFDFAARPLGFGHNDLQPVAQRLCPEILQAISWLKGFGLNARMTGSGSAVFANIPEVDFGQVVSKLESTPHQNGWQLKVCKNLDVHPFAGWASSDR